MDDAVKSWNFLPPGGIEETQVPETRRCGYIKAVYRSLLVILIVLFSFGPSVSLGQTAKNDSSALLKELLAMPAPTPRNAATPVIEELKQRSPEFYSRRTPPPDDAPIGDLLAYWERWLYMGNRLAPSPVVLQRLVDHCVENPDKLPRFLRLFHTTEKLAVKVKELYDKAADDETVEPVWRDTLKNWLVFNSKYYLDELLALARRVKDTKDGGVNKEDALIALAKIDWTNAEPLVRSLMASGQPRSSALALSLFYAHANQEKDVAAEENYRRVLQQIAGSSAQPGYARNMAINALGGAEWSGRDEWYINLFQDETLLSLIDGQTSFSPLSNLFQSDPDKWIPAVARLLESKDVKVRSAAASCLLAFQGEESRKDALLPLLPWLSDPAWITDNESSLRLRLIQTLTWVDVPESVPGLISVLENKDETNHTRSYAGSVLAKYKDPRAAPALKKTLAAEKEESNRQRIIEGLMACQGLTDAEQLEGIEAYAAKVSKPEGVMDMNAYHGDANPLELPLSIGRYLAQMAEPPVPLVRTVLARAESLKSQNPELAQMLLGFVHQWQGRLIDFDMINRIASGVADAKVITMALSRREKMIENLRPEMEGLAAASGIAPGVGAVLLNDGYLGQSILSSGDQSTQIALLACSRLTQTPLPVEVVGSFLKSRNELLVKAAELYLLAEDSTEAREILWRHHPNKAYVTGWREAGAPVVFGGLEDMSKMEDKLRAELFAENGPVEIFALIRNQQPYSKVLRIYADKAVYTDYEDTARYRERTVPQAEVSNFKDFIATNGVLDLGPTIEWCHHGCPPQEFLSITKEKGRRVFSQLGFIDRQSVNGHFEELGVGATTHYNLEKEIKGLEVLFDDPVLNANDVWQQDGQLRVYVERMDETVEPEQSTDSDDDDDDERDEKFLEGIRRDVTRNRARFSWRVFENGTLGDVASQPDVYEVVDPLKFLSSEFYDEDDFENNAIMLTPDSIIIVAISNGMWKQFAGAQPVHIGDQDANYSDAVVTGDRKWLVVSKTKSDSDDPYHIVRMNLQTGREFKVKLEPADDLTPVTFIPNLGKVLLRRARGDDKTQPIGPERPEYYLLDAATGATRLVSGEFEPLRQYGYRFLQRTEKPDEYWAALPDETKHQTQIGRYSVRDFSFKQTMLVPHIVFDSRSMSVDAKQGKVYVVYAGQLLRLPLQTPAAAAAK